ncbi:MAG: fatty acid desaturase family protein [Phycisphaerae bacterium]
MYLKTAVVLGCLGTLYTLLVFAPVTWWLAVPLTILLGLSLAAVGFNVQHDGGHGAYSDHRWINKLAATTLDLLGASSYVWARKHNSIHHSYTNITGHDDDINVGLLGRLSPHQRRLWFHRLQHVYLWFLYGFLAIKWHLYDDFHDVLTGRVGEHRLPRPRGRELLTFVGGKIVFFTLTFALPMLLHPWWIVLSVYAAAAFVQGVVLSVVFQLAHCVEEAEFPMPNVDTGRMAIAWAEHQVKTTVDFAPCNRLLTWFVGGLNYQIEHHLFPQICHIHYPALASLVQQTCREFGLPYMAQKSLLVGVASHFRWLRKMSLAVSPADEPSPGAARWSAGAA